MVTVRNNVAAAYAPQWRTTAQRLYPQADAVVAVSQGVGESVQRTLGVDAARLHVIYNGVPAERIRRLAQEEVAHPWFRSRSSAGDPQRGARVVPEGLPDPRGGVRGGRAARVQARLLILGRLSPRYRAQLRSLAGCQGVERDLGFLDFDENPYRYMKRAGLLALSSRWEGLPTVGARSAGLRPRRS